MTVIAQPEGSAHAADALEIALERGAAPIAAPEVDRQAPATQKGRFMTLAVSYILISVLAGAFGQLLLKFGMNRMGAVTLAMGDVLELLLRLALNPYVVAGLALYGCGTIFWLAGISRVDLSYAYPFASLSYVVMLLVAWQLFDEQITLPRIIGTVVIATGVLIVSRG